MKKKRSRKSKIFNSVNIILIALLFVELVFIAKGVTTGNPVRSVVLGGETRTSTTQNSLGQLVTKEGKVELIVQDNFEKPELSKELYYLNENGKRYLLSTDQPLPISAKIKVTGYLKDNVLSFSNSQTKSASLQGTSYTTTSTTIESLSQILGDKKYIVVYLLGTNDSDFNATSRANNVLNLANNFMINTSYGKASLSMGFAKSFQTNITGCIPESYMDYAISMIDPFVNFRQYDGIIVYHPFSSDPCYGGMGSVGKVYLPNDGGVSLYEVWVDGIHDNSEVLDHEVGHNFGLDHAALLYCGEYPNVKSLDFSCRYNNYGDSFDIMGSGNYPYSLRNKLEVLGWVDNINVLKTTQGTFFIRPQEEDLTNTLNIYGLKVPILWNVSSITVINDYGSQVPLDYFNPFTNYYIEYRKQFNQDYLNWLKFLKNETTYKFNLTEIKDGVFIRLGADSQLFGDTLLLSEHPNAIICYSSVTQDVCYNDVYTFPYLLKNETYVDNFNLMNITVLDMNESGALIKITRFSTCTDTDGGLNYNVRGTVTVTNFSGTYNYIDSCITTGDKTTANLKEFYCNNNQAISTSYKCVNGCFNGACKSPASGSPSCYYDKIKRAYVCK
ncbi:hypothetical protein HY212_01390 [Candidatus Pacearchaeota archaeon]|nr:hypothetical protein [Candidatus Pacearchaeota archaeon]